MRRRRVPSARLTRAAPVNSLYGGLGNLSLPSLTVLALSKNDLQGELLTNTFAGMKQLVELNINGNLWFGNLDLLQLPPNLTKW